MAPFCKYRAVPPALTVCLVQLPPWIVSRDLGGLVLACVFVSRRRRRLRPRGPASAVGGVSPAAISPFSLPGTEDRVLDEAGRRSVVVALTSCPDRWDARHLSSRLPCFLVPVPFPHGLALRSPLGCLVQEALLSACPASTHACLGEPRHFWPWSPSQPCGSSCHLNTYRPL